MKTEFLKDLGLTDEQIASVMAENGKDIKKEKDKADEFERELKDSNTQLKQANDTISDLKKNNADNEELQKKVNKYEEDMKTQKENYEKEINDMKYANALNDVLSKYPFQDDDAKEFAISKIKDKTEFKNGEFIGINDVMADMKKNTGYLFKVDPKGTGSFVTGGAEGSDSKPGNENIATKLGKQRAEASKTKGIADFAKN